MRTLLIFCLLTALSLPPQAENGTVPAPPALPVGLYDLQFVPRDIWPGDDLVIQVGIIDNGRGVKRAETVYVNGASSLSFTYTMSDTVYQTEAITWLSRTLTTTKTMTMGRWRLASLIVTDNTERVWVTFYVGDKVGFNVLYNFSHIIYIPMVEG
jgi:hypothetical protein